MSEFTKEEMLALANEVDALNPWSDAAWPELCERAATALRALAASMDAEPVAIKALEWKDGPVSSGMLIADTVFGQYWVWEIDGTGVWSRGVLPGTIAGAYISSAKAAAQADYETRIRPAIANNPPHHATERVTG